MVLTELPRWCNGEESACQCSRHERHEFDPWVGRSPRLGNGNPLQYSCLENSMVREARWVTVCGFSKSTHTERLSTNTQTYTWETKEGTAQCFGLQKRSSPSYKKGNKILIRILWSVSLQNVNALTSKENDSRQLPQSHLLEKSQSWGWDKMLGV